MGHTQSTAFTATEFEYRHQTLVHQLIVGAAFLTYLIDRDDVVWRFVKDSAVPHRLERYVFIAAAGFIAVGAAICTWARVHPMRNSSIGVESYRTLDYRQHLGDFFYAIGLGSLAPLLGFLVLVGGELVRVFRLGRRADDNYHPLSAVPAMAIPEINLRWKKAFQQEAAKWGILVTMIIFVITLQDRHAELLAIASFFVGMLFKAPIFSRSRC